ncbi:phage tail tape measure protein [Bifidobacterium sp. B4107]|uniref:phage tail tape measure protein n=1 Tax=unclassified Bifidobacterium TaxID=2608897 RepID=UPI00226B2107|nr:MULTISPECIES: phage tail tape measure protein [unclassified Bifidobacterium]MCX8647137.1 phage tail tape measure protein [Bifidobacterium sp. B4107]MCX8651317.1 phage tail tape measure protein [Bifidobacterium sp. B4111]MCX8657747.1 phage tail tape measure protein [Bifidobacterium sp. B4114]
MALNQNIVIRLMADSTDYTAKMQAASASATELSTALERPMSKGERFSAMGQKVALGVGALSAAVGVAAVKAFADFDQSMSAVEANTGASADTMGRLRDAALEAGARTVYSATESADAINELAKAGVSTTDILQGGLDGALDLAASGQMGVADAAELTASALNEFGLQGNQASHVADLLAAGANTAQGGVSDMGEALKMVGTTASQLGMSIEDTTGAITMMASQGIVGSDAGTQLRSALIGLTSASGPAKAEMQQLGISMYDSQGNFVGLANFAGQLKEKLSALTPEQRANAMGVLFSNAAMSVGNTLYEQGAEGVNKFTKQVNQQGFAAKQAAALTDNLKGDVEQFGGAVETSLIKIGSGANGPIRSVIQSVTSLVTAFGDLPAPVQQTVVMLGMAAGAGVGLHKVFGQTAQSTSALSRSFGMVVDPVQRVQAAMGNFSSAVEQIKLSTLSYEEQMRRVGTATSGSALRMGALKSAGAGIVDLLGGPWGIALGVAGAALTAFANHAAQAKAAQDELSQAMAEGGDASEKLVDMITSGNNIDWGWVQHLNTGFGSLDDMLQACGISAGTFARAAQGSKTAIDQVNKALEANKQSGSQYYGVITEGQTKLSQLTKVYKNSTEETKRNKEGKDELASSEKKAADAAGQHAQAQGQSAEQTQKAADASSILSNQLNASNKGVNEESSALGEAVDALKQYYGFKLGAFDADTKWGEALSAADEAVKKNGKSLDAFNPKGQANRKALKDLATAAQDCAEAHARNGEGIDKVSQVMEEGRQKVIDYAKAMGMSDGDATAFADSVGLSSGRVKDLVNQIERANAKPLKIKDEASKTLKQVGLAAKGLPDGKTIQITGKNKDAMMAIREVTGAKIDDKHSKLTLDKHQYDMALALANGATIDTKTGQLKGDNSDHWKKIAQSNGWKIDPKTGVISGNDGPFMAVRKAVDNATIRDKTVHVGAEASGFWSVVNSILGKVFHVNISATGGHAAGGLITGPGTGTSDDIPARLSNGEYVIRASAVRQYGTEMLNAINWQRYATGGYVQKYEATPITPNLPQPASQEPRIVYEQPVTFHQHVVQDPYAQSALDSAKVRHATLGLLRRGGML